MGRIYIVDNIMITLKKYSIISELKPFMKNVVKTNV